MTASIAKEQVKHDLAPQQLLRHYGVAFKVSGDQLRTRSCPVCGERSSDSVVMNRLDGRWQCKAHGHQGDLLGWIAARESLSCRDDFAEVLARAQAISAMTSPLGDAERPPRALPSDRTAALQFARTHVPALWDQLQGPRGDARAYLEGRGLGALAQRPDLVRATSTSFRCDTRWHQRVRGLLSVPAIVVPTYDLDDGQIENLTCRRIGVGEPKVVGLPQVPKTLGGIPLGTFGRWADFSRRPRNVVLVEGVADYLTACLVMPDWLVLGVDGGSLLAGVVARIAEAIVAAGTTLRLVPHNDRAGELAAGAAVDRAAEVGLALGHGLELLDVGPGNDLNDALCAGATSVVVPPRPACLNTVVGRVAMRHAERSTVAAPVHPAPLVERPGVAWITPLADFLGDEEPDEDDRADWIIRDIIPSGEPAMIAGPPKSGKTWLATDLALSIASGTPWLGRDGLRSAGSQIQQQDNAMIDEFTLFERGHHAVLAALEQDDGSLSVDVLAQACSRQARALLASREESLGWANAAVACYERAAERRTVGYDRQGSEVILFGLAVLMIVRWGPETGNRVLDPERLTRWIQDEIEEQEDPNAFREALAGAASASQREHAICLRERLRIALPLFQKGFLSSSIGDWLACAGLMKETLSSE